MVRVALRIRGAALRAVAAALSASVLVCPLAAAEPGPAGVLVDYGFDEEIPTGPDTVRVFEHARGRVALSSAFRYGGYRSLELRAAIVGALGRVHEALDSRQREALSEPLTGGLFGGFRGAGFGGPYRM